MKIKHFISSLFLITLGFTASAQYMQDINGRVIRETSYTDVEGSPYLSDSWSVGSVKLADGNEFKDVPLKYNQVEDKVIFKNKAGDQLESIIPVTAFKINYLDNAVMKAASYQSGFKPVDGSNETTFYEVIADGAVKLIKRNKKVVISTKPYNSASTIQTITMVSTYYLVKGNDAPVKIKVDKKSLIAALTGKTLEIENYIKENKIDLKNDSDLNLLFTYYNQAK